MGSDRARRSYNPSRQYRSVVQQQGRVVLEADLNEAQELSAEILRKEVIDIVGPYGTPDDGYRLSFPTPNPNRDFSVGAGTPLSVSRWRRRPSGRNCSTGCGEVIRRARREGRCGNGVRPASARG